MMLNDFLTDALLRECLEQYLPLAVFVLVSCAPLYRVPHVRARRRELCTPHSHESVSGTPK